MTLKMVASEILICGLKKVPVAGQAVEAIEALRAKHAMTQHADRIGAVEEQLSRFETRHRDLVAEEFRAILENLRRPAVAGSRPRSTQRL